MIELLYALFWWSTTLTVWSYWYTFSSALFLVYYAIKIVNYLFFSARKKKHRSDLFYSFSEHEEEEETPFENMYDYRKRSSDSEKEITWSDEDEDDNENAFCTGRSGAAFDSKAPMSFDSVISTLTRWFTYVCLGSIILFVLIVFGGVCITFLDKLQEERQIRDAYYQAVAECDEKSIRSGEILRACQNARRETGKSSVFGAIKKTFFEMVRSMDACVWYLKSSPAAWLLLALGLFALACKLLWSDRNDKFPYYFRNLFHRRTPRRTERTPSPLHRSYKPDLATNGYSIRKRFGEIEIPQNSLARVVHSHVHHANHS